MADPVQSKPSGISKRGFASMDPARQREIARKGGASVAFLRIVLWPRKLGAKVAKPHTALAIKTPSKSSPKIRSLTKADFKEHPCRAL